MAHILKKIGNVLFHRKAEQVNPLSHKGFTLIELLIVIAIIGILAAVAVPNYISSRRKAQIAGVASDIKYFEKGFMAYAIDEGYFPDDSHIVLPDLPTMEKYIDSDVWEKTTAMGGTYNWDGPNFYPYAGIAFFEPSAPQEEMELLDGILDNGDINSGKFRKTSNGRYTYIIDE